MIHSLKIVVGWASAIIAGTSLFLLILIVTGVGPGWPRLPRQTTATVVSIDREIVSAQPPRYQYIAIVRWTNEHGVVIQQREAWGRAQPDISEGTTVPAVIFWATADPKTRSSPAQIGLGSVRDYWRKRGFGDWASFWGPILAFIPATFIAYALLQNPSVVRSKANHDA